MSRIGKMPIAIPDGVAVTVKGSVVSAKGPQGELSMELPSYVTAEVSKSEVKLLCAKSDRSSQAMYGTCRSLLASKIRGVKTHYVKALQIQGVGFRAQIQGSKLVLSLGYSHPVEYTVPAGVIVKVADGVNLTVSGADKHDVGQVSARIRSFYPPEPYKGKGVRYKDEHVRHKAGKTVA